MVTSSDLLTATAIATGIALLLLWRHHRRRTLSSPRTPRKILLLKGLVFGIPESKYVEALEKAEELVNTKSITTVAWDGDKLTYANKSTGAPPTASFTRLLPMLRRRWPSLEFIFFKKLGKAAGLIEGGLIEAAQRPDWSSAVLWPVAMSSAS